MSSNFFRYSRIPALACLLGLAFMVSPAAAHAEEPGAVVRAAALNGGRVNPMLFGNFVELLDDVVPGMWAEMLNDRSFEGVLKAANWSYYDGAPDFCDRKWDTNETWAIDTSEPFNGARSAKLTATRTRPATLSQPGLAVTRGMTYRFSGYFRSDAALAVTLHLKARLPDGSWMTLGSAKLPKASSAWRRYEAQMESRGETDRAVFELRAEGRGTLWADKLSLMPSDNLDGWRRDVVDVIRDAHPAIVRWGGSSCDPGKYRWKSGIGDRDLRTPFTNEIWGRIDPDDVGIDEFCRFCERIQAEPLVCLSFSDGPQSAADLVEYCNGTAQTTWGARRAANGHPAPYHVKYWQVGNEISGDNADYLARFGEFVRLIRTADSNAKILSSFPSQKLLDRFGADIFCVCPHHYTPDLAECDRDFASITKMLDSTPGCGGVGIAVTEWNISGGDWGLGRARQMTLGGALTNARYLHVLMRHCDKAKIACRSNMANSYCGAIIETDPANVLRRPSYYVMQLYARHAKPVPLQITKGSNGPDIFACAAEDGKSAAVFCINTSGEPMRWTLRSEGFAAPLRVASCETLHDTEERRQPDIVNHIDFPERIRTTPLAFSENTVELPAFSATAVECVLADGEARK
jgi:alpha-N-arabinofuranosidase